MRAKLINIGDYVHLQYAFSLGALIVLNRYTGCLLGLACGDALGGAVEFRSREEIRADHPGGLRDFVGGGWLHLFPGEITDDTQMMLAIAESLGRGGPLNMDDIAARFVTWFASRPKDIGNITRAAIQLIDAGVPWDQAGERVHARSNGRAAGNGSIMRCAPVALRFHSQPETMRQASIDTSRITHADQRCTQSAVVVNQAISQLLMEEDHSTVIEGALLGIGDEDVRKAVERAGRLKQSDVPNGGFVLDTLTAALWALLNHDSLEETVVAAVALGGDTDTTAAVAGALAGARYGVEAIPERWLTLLQHRERITELAEILFHLNVADQLT